MQPSTSSPVVHGRRVTLTAVALLGACSLRAADITVGTEYIYPTTYTVIPGQTGGGGVAGGGNVISTPTVEPGGFQTRMIGTSLHAEALVADFTTSEKETAAIDARGKNGNTELMIAAATGDEPAVAQLLKKPIASVNAANQFGSTALMGAAAGGYDNIIALLLQRGAQVNAKSHKGSTALMFAAKNGHTEVVRQLLAAGAAVDTTDEQGQTALLYAVGAENVEAASLLTKAGANVNARTRTGASPLRVASNARTQDLIQLLTRSGAKNCAASSIAPWPSLPSAWPAPQPSPTIRTNCRPGLPGRWCLCRSC